MSIEGQIDAALRTVLSRNGVEPSEKLLEDLGQLCWLLLPDEVRRFSGALNELEWRYLGKLGKYEQ